MKEEDNDDRATAALADAVKTPKHYLILVCEPAPGGGTATEVYSNIDPAMVGPLLRSLAPRLDATERSRK